MTLTVEQFGPVPVIVPFLDLGGGLDTVTDNHALTRNQLAQSVNCWHAYGRSLSKRPGSTPFVSATGATGGGGVGTGCVTARFAGATYVIVQVNTSKLYAAKATDTTWTLIGTMAANAGSICAAQMYDPGSGKNTLFIVNGVDKPFAWQGPATTLVAASTLTGAALPLNLTGTAIITPSYVTTYQNFMLYSGEATAPEAVYVSDPFKPNSFTVPASLTKIGSDASYEPYYVGFNDGVSGGNITGLMALEEGVVIFKQAAIYSFSLTSFYGDTIFYPKLVSASVGCTSPRSIVRFDGYGAFLGIDGVYTVSLNAVPDMVSGAVSTYFDSSFAGYTATITDNTTAIGVRHGGRYIVFFSSARTSYNNDTGMWFSFRKLDALGKPTCGEINGMQVGGAAPLRGPGDDGNFVWVDSSFDRVSKFGLGFADPVPAATGYANPITATFVGKAEFLEELFPTDGFIRPKRVNRIWLVLSLFGHLSSGQFTGSLTFTGTWLGGGSSGIQSSGNTQTLPVAIGGATTWGANWGTLVWSGSSAAAEPYALIEMDTAAATIANNFQIGFSESSQNGWVVIGYMVEVVPQQPLQGSYNVL